MSSPARILYCNCTYAQVVPKEVKSAVLKGLSDSAVAFEAVADLCEMSARRDPQLKRLSQGNAPLKIAACYPRAVKWLFSAAQAPLPEESCEVLNMRADDAQTILGSLLPSSGHHDPPAANVGGNGPPSADVPASPPGPTNENPPDPQKIA